MRNLDSVIYDNYNVLAIVDQSKVGYYGYVPIIKVEQIQQYDYDKIIIMIKNEKVDDLGFKEDYCNECV